jgi:hypothetical protein
MVLEYVSLRTHYRLPSQKEVDWLQEKPVRGADSKSRTSSSVDYRSSERNATYDLAMLNFRRVGKCSKDNSEQQQQII